MVLKAYYLTTQDDNSALSIEHCNEHINIYEIEI